MIDLHCHILPGIDDGPATWQASIDLCRQAAADGTAVMIATPHLRHELWWNGERAPLVRLVETLREELGGILEVHPGGEIAVHSQSQRELDELPDGELLTLAGSRYVLLEFDYHGLGPDPIELVHELTVRGWRPIIAHPERIPWMAGQPRLLHGLVEHGAHLQLTAMSVTGRLGRRIQDLCRRLLTAEQVDFIASDAHNIHSRPPGLRDAYEAVGRQWGHDRAERIFERNPRAVLEDRPLIDTLAAAPQAGRPRLL